MIVRIKINILSSSFILENRLKNQFVNVSNRFNSSLCRYNMIKLEPSDIDDIHNVLHLLIILNEDLIMVNKINSIIAKIASKLKDIAYFGILITRCVDVDLRVYHRGTRYIFIYVPHVILYLEMFDFIITFPLILDPHFSEVNAIILL